MTATKGPDLGERIQAAIAAYNSMTPEQKAAHDEAQRRSFVRGQFGISHPEMSREEVCALVDKVCGSNPWTMIEELQATIRQQRAVLEEQKRLLVEAAIPLEALRMVEQQQPPPRFQLGKEIITAIVNATDRIREHLTAVTEREG